MALFGQTDTADQGDALGLLPWTNSRRTAVTPAFLDTTDANAVTQQQDQTPPARTANPNQSQIRLPEKAARMAAPPDVQQNAAPPAIAAPTTGPDLNRDVYQGRVAAPSQSDYPAPKIPLWRRIAGAAVGGTEGYATRDAARGAQLGAGIVDEGARQAQQKYAQDTQRFNTAYERGRQEQQDQAAQQNAEREASATKSENDLRKAEQGQYEMVPVNMPDGTQVMVQRKDAERMQAALAGNQTRADIANKNDQARTDIANKTDQTKKDIAASRPGKTAGAGKGPLAAQQKATAAIGSLNQQLAQRKIQEPAYIDQSIQEWKNVAQAARAAGETPTGTQDLAVLYLKKYGNRDAAIKAMAADGWQVQ